MTMVPRPGAENETTLLYSSHTIYKVVQYYLKIDSNMWKKVCYKLQSDLWKKVYIYNKSNRRWNAIINITQSKRKQEKKKIHRTRKQIGSKY